MVLALCQQEAGDMENALENIRTSTDLANQHGFSEEEISNLEEIERVISGETDTHQRPEG